MTVAGRMKRWWKRTKSSLIEDCPPEVHACELCDELDCDGDRWNNCSQRLATLERIKKPEKTAPEQTEPVRRDRAPAVSKN